MRMQSLRFAVRSSVLSLRWKRLRTMPPKRPKHKVRARSSRTKTVDTTLFVLQAEKKGGAEPEEGSGAQQDSNKPEPSPEKVSNLVSPTDSLISVYKIC